MSIVVENTWPTFQQKHKGWAKTPMIVAIATTWAFFWNLDFLKN